MAKVNKNKRNKNKKKNEKKISERKSVNKYKSSKKNRDNSSPKEKKLKGRKKKLVKTLNESSYDLNDMIDYNNKNKVYSLRYKKEDKNKNNKKTKDFTEDYLYEKSPNKMNIQNDDNKGGYKFHINTDNKIMKDNKPQDNNKKKNKKLILEDNVDIIEDNNKNEKFVLYNDNSENSNFKKDNCDLLLISNETFLKKNLEENIKLKNNIETIKFLLKFIMKNKEKNSLKNIFKGFSEVNLINKNINEIINNDNDNLQNQVKNKYDNYSIDENSNLINFVSNLELIINSYNIDNDYNFDNKDNNNMNENILINKDINRDENMRLKLYLHNFMLNDKNISWTVDIQKISDWCCIGIMEIDFINVDEIKEISIFNLLDTNYYLLSNNFYLIFSNGKKFDIKKLDKVISVNNGNIRLTFLYNKHILIIENEKGYKIIKQISYNLDKTLVPCFISKNKSDIINFKDFFYIKNVYI